MGNKIEDVKIRIVNILKDKFNININLLSEKNFDKALTGTIFGFGARELVYLFFEVEKEFEVKLDTIKLLEYQFNTIDGISNLIIEQKGYCIV